MPPRLRLVQTGGLKLNQVMEAQGSMDDPQRCTDTGARMPLALAWPCPSLHRELGVLKIQCRGPPMGRWNKGLSCRWRPHIQLLALHFPPPPTPSTLCSVQVFQISCTGRLCTPKWILWEPGHTRVERRRFNLRHSPNSSGETNLGARVGRDTRRGGRNHLDQLPLEAPDPAGQGSVALQWALGIIAPSDCTLNLELNLVC